MRYFKIDITDGINIPKQISLWDIYPFIPQISEYYDICGIQLRCVEHQRGYVILKNDEFLVKFKETY